MDNTFTTVRKNGIEEQILTNVITALGKDKIIKMGWEILPLEPMEVQEFKRLRNDNKVTTELVTEEVIKQMPVEREKRKYNKKD